MKHEHDMPAQERQNKLSASLFRMVHLLTLLSYEFAFFSTFKMPSGIKNVLHRGIRNYDSCIEQIKTYLPNSKQAIDDERRVSDEKVHAIGSIIEKLFLLDEEQVIALEKDFDEHIKIDYSGTEGQEGVTMEESPAA